ncbi:MAG: hypothetical protein KJ558_10125 [Gammaproteobacteria bacterium]|nr:hypothetical protein [Gammaproteobacteria bacterium]MBU1655163.1 hypothetical protein [Gammaproteobacteria bacterium]MBU1959974.1 hypothetical protein [Gammaproteobacteria bacterium]
MTEEVKMAQIISVRILSDENEADARSAVNSLLQQEKEINTDEEGMAWLVDWTIDDAVPVPVAMDDAICNGTYTGGDAFRVALPEVTEPFELVVDAYATNEFADPPGFAVITVDTTFLRVLTRLRRVLAENSLDDVGFTYYPKQWHRDEELRIQGDALRVTSGGNFWLEGRLKHCDWSVETRPIDIDDFLKVVSDGPAVEPKEPEFRWVDGRLFYGSSLDWVIEAFAGENGENGEEGGEDE